MQKQDEYVSQFKSFCDKVLQNKTLTDELLKKTGIFTPTGRISKNFNHTLSNVSKAK